MYFSDDNLEVFRRENSVLRQVDTCSDAAEILDGFRGSFDLMRFRLVYDGDLKAGGSRPRAREKWALREAFRPQLASLSATHPVMQGIGFTTELHEATYLGPSSRPVSPARVSIDVPIPLVQAAQSPREVAGHGWRRRAGCRS
jgi:hypothetical protein